MQSKIKHPKEVGATGFSQKYWENNYANPEEMDNISNSHEHVLYLKAIFALEGIDVSSVVDLGFGLGFLFEAVLATFYPYRALGIEPSAHAYEFVKNKNISPAESTKLKLLNCDLLAWCQKDLKKDRTFDLGICTSVFQYLTDDEIKQILPVLSQRVKYLYFSVPTDEELKKQIEEVEFFDEYAIHRKREKYVKMLRPYFTFVSSRLLESKYHFNQDNSHFTDLLFRF